MNLPVSASLRRLEPNLSLLLPRVLRRSLDDRVDWSASAFRDMSEQVLDDIGPAIVHHRVFVTSALEYPTSVPVMDRNELRALESWLLHIDGSMAARVNCSLMRVAPSVGQLYRVRVSARGVLEEQCADDFLSLAHLLSTVVLTSYVESWGRAWSRWRGPGFD